MSETYELVKFVDGSFELEVNVSPEEDTVWLTQEQIAALFDTARSTVAYHIGNIIRNNEVDERTSVEFFDKSIRHRPSKYYNLDVILAVGYKVNSKRGILFRQWANKILKSYMLRGFAVEPSRVLVSRENYLDLVNVVNRITGKEISDFNAQYPSLEVHITDEFHDRFLILDRKSMYHIGASVKDAGRRTFEISENKDGRYLDMILERLNLNNSYK